MPNYRRKLLVNLLKLSDVIILTVSIIFTLWFVKYRSSIGIEQIFYLQITFKDLILFICLSLLWHLIFNSFHLYGSRRLSKNINEWADIVKAITTSIIIFAIPGYILYKDTVTLSFLGFLGISSITLTISFRILLRFVLGKVRSSLELNLRYVLIVGTNQRAYDFARIIEEKNNTGYRLLGYIDEYVHIPKNGIKILGAINELPNVLSSYIVDEIFIALPIKSYYEEISLIVEKAEEQGIKTRYLSQLFNTKFSISRADVFEGYSVLTMATGPQQGWAYLVKRILDLILGAILLVFMSPIMLFVAFAIKLTYKGPILYIQDRVGYNKRIFRIYKFRTMVVNAEAMQKDLEHMNEMEGPVFKISDDPRVTGLGRWLRKASIDELPQLFNVLKGDMSLVGPRPLPVRDFSGFKQDWKCRRFSVLPGITCTWQINGRNHISFEDWMKLDMEYIDNWTLSNDIKILLRTIPAVVRGRGAA
ncbi:MAG: sugar transferase [Nitrospirae bacterium]|nr:sugar transferase [Nitrospirota bacterium]